MNNLLSCKVAAEHIAAGQIIAYPTEAIYGLGCDPRNETALHALINLKDRDSTKGLIVVARDLNQLHGIIDAPDDATLERIAPTWPGPVTWIMAAHKNCSELLTGGRQTIAVRISAHPVVSDLCRCADSAMVSTSANLSGQAPMRTPEQIMSAFGSSIAGVVAGELGGLHSATSIFDASTGTQLR